LVHIQEVLGGAACDCICPACKEPLIARKGEVVAHHFAHRPQSVCVSGPETALHLAAKQIIAERLTLRLPAVEVDAKGIRKRRAPSKIVKFDSASIEHRLEGVIADVMMTVGGRQLLVEVLVTHECDEEKMARIEALGIAAVEIDLGSVPRDASLATIEAAVVKGGRRRWLFNPLLEETRREHEAAVAERERQRAAKADRAARALADSWLQLAKVERAAATPEQAAVVRQVCAVGLGELLGAPIRGEQLFCVERTVWQAEVVRAAVIDPASVWHHGFGVMVQNLFERLRKKGLLAAPFAKFHGSALLHRTRELEPTFTHPEATLRRYLRHLEEHGVLVEQDEAWRLPETISRQIAARSSKFDRAEDRRVQLRTRAVRVLARAAVTQASFDLEAWCDRTLEGWSGSPDEIAYTGGDPWEALKIAMEALESALGGGADPQDLLALPIAEQLLEAASERDAAAERRRMDALEREIRAGNRRVAAVEARAVEVLGHEADAWLHHAVAALGGASRRDLARESQEKADRLLAELERVLDRKLAAAEEERRRVEHENRARLARGRLRRLADDACGEDWGRVFMQSPFSQLGGYRPMDVCVDDASLERCRALIPARRPGARLSA
jgi:hypothetical protein